jgi:hypothetical protein
MRKAAIKRVAITGRLMKIAETFTAAALLLVMHPAESAAALDSRHPSQNFVAGRRDDNRWLV